MPFSLSDFLQYKKSAGDSFKTTTEPTGDNKNMTASAVKNLVPGQTITGEVVAMKDGEVQLEIDKDMYVTAKLERNLAIALGQTLTFEVSGNSASQIILRPLFANLSQDPNLQKALESANLPITKDTMSLVSSMMEAGLSVDKQSLQGMYRDLMNFKSALPEDLVLLKKLSLPVNEENLKMVANYRNNSHQLVQGVLDVLEELPKTAQNFFQVGNGKDGVLIYQTMFDLLKGYTGKIGGSPFDSSGNLSGQLTNQQGQSANLQGQSVTSSNQNMGLTGALSGTIEDVTGKESGIVNKNVNLNPISNLNSINNLNILNTETELLDQNAGIAKQLQGSDVLQLKEAKIWSELSKTLNVTMTEQSASGSTNLNAPLPPIETLPGATTLTGEVKEVLSKNELRNLEQLLLKAGVPNEVIDSMKHQPQSINQFFSAMKELLQQAQSTSLPELKELLISKECNKLLQNEVLKQWFLEPEAVGKQDEVKDLYERIHRQTQMIANAMNDIGKENNTFDRGLQQLRGNLEFMNQVNQFYSYVQLPLKMGRQNANGELYVYTDKKSLAQHEGNVSALLHLEMDQLGTMDVYVTMQQDKVNTKFYLPDEETIIFLEKHIHMLDERLQKRGYDSSTEFSKREKEVSVVEEMTKKSTPKGESLSLLGQYSFDVRA